MAGERSAYFIEMAERGAQRLTERLAMIADRYVPQDETVTVLEMIREYELTGHMPPGDGCTSEVCLRARRIYVAALQALQQGGQ